MPTKKSRRKSIKQSILGEIKKTLLRGRMDARSIIQDGLKYNILSYIVEHPKCTSTEIRNACHCSDGTVSKKLSELEKQGIVKRTIEERNEFIKINHWTTDIIKITHEFTYESRINLIDVFILVDFLFGILMVFITNDLTHAADFGIFTILLFTLKHYY